MTETFEAKAKKGRCLAFPGYCPKTIATCEFAHPLVNCERYPKCFPQCTYLHPICNYDCKKILCPSRSGDCLMFHPWRDSYRQMKKKLPDPDGTDIDEFSRLRDPPLLAELLAKYDPNNIHEYGGESSMTTSMTSKTHGGDNPLEDEINEVKRRIILLDMEINDTKFHAGKCFECINAAASIILLPCQHLIFCKRCFSRTQSLNRDSFDPIECILCGNMDEGFMDVYAH